MKFNQLEEVSDGNDEQGIRLEQGGTEVKKLLAVAGSKKTLTLARDAVGSIGSIQTVFAVRTITNAKLLERTLKEQLEKSFKPYNSDRCIRRVDSENKNSGFVNHRLEVVLKDEGVRIIIITHKTLIEFSKWSEYGQHRVLNIDELPPAIEMASKVLADKQLGALGLSVSDFDHIKTSPGLVKTRARPLHEEDSVAEGVYASDTSNLWKVLSEADEGCISSELMTDKKRIRISAINESGIFDAMSHFKEVRLSTMLFSKSLFEIIGKAKGIRFTDYEWENQNKPFKYDHRVTLYVMSEGNGIASRYKLDTKDADNETLFRRIIKKALKIPEFRDSYWKILLYANKDKSGIERWNALQELGVQNKFELMPFDCHGHHHWQDEGRTRFALLLTNRWNPMYDDCGKGFADKLGISFDDLKHAYEVSQMLEPTAQAATRGVVRSDDPNGLDSHIAVIDKYIAEWLVEHVFPNAAICADYALKPNMAKKAEPRKDAKWQGVVKAQFGLTKEQARWVDNNIGKMEARYGHPLSFSNGEHIEKVRAYTVEKRPEFGIAA